MDPNRAMHGWIRHATGALALRASIASYLSHTCGCSTRTDDSSTSIGTSDTIYQQGVGGWVKRKRSRGSTAPPHGTPRQQSRRGIPQMWRQVLTRKRFAIAFLGMRETAKRLNDTVNALSESAFLKALSQLFRDGLREGSRSLGYACFLGYLDDETRHVS